MIKCNYHSCKKELNSEKKEVYSLRIRKGFTNAPGGKRYVNWDGWRFFCKDHHELITTKRIPLTLSLVYGPRVFKNKKKREKISGFKKNSNK